MSLYSEYIKEREGKETIENEFGFATYCINGDVCYIVDIYVVKEKRRSHMAKQLADQIADIAKEQGVKYLLGSVDHKLPSATDSMKVLLAYGMSFQSVDDQLLLFVKEI